MRRLLALTSALLAVIIVPAAPTAAAGTASAIPPPPGDIAGVELVANIPEAVEATAINFLVYGRGARARHVMIANGRFGLKTYDVTDPAQPVLLDELTNDELMLPSDVDGTFWQNEDMDVDPQRKLVFMSRDPRAYNGASSDPDAVSGVYIVDAADPANLALITFHAVPTGHTSTCVNHCRYLWTGGPASNTDQLPEFPLGRPVFVTDIRDPWNPVTFPDPVDLGRVDGVTGYSHDVQVDAAGVAWVSGLGGVRGYWTDGWRRDPLLGEWRRATPWNPVPYAGGGIGEAAAPTGFMHNSIRPVGRTLDDGPVPGRGNLPGRLLLATEEAFDSPTCDGVGQFVISSLDRSFNGQGWRSTPEDPFRLRTIGTWSVHDKEGTIPDEFCSAHYFDMQRRVVAYSWYIQGTRFLDISDPANPIQIAYYRPDGGVAWAPYFHGDHVFVADHVRGVDILRLTPEAAQNQAAGNEIAAPPLSARAQTLVAQAASRFSPDPDLGWSCVLPRT
ncbi:MAG: LVIVD repeat-containing protein [Acidimicrobiales bacterium]